MSKLEQIIQDLQKEGLWISGHEKSLREKLFYALYKGPVKNSEK